MSSVQEDHGLPYLGIGATAWREIINAMTELLTTGIWKRGDFGDLPDISGETTPGQWFYAEDARAIFYDDGTDWRLVSSESRRTLATAGALEALTAYDHEVLIDTDANSTALDLNLDGGDGAAGHAGLSVIVRRSVVSAHVAKVSFTSPDGAVEEELPSLDDWLVLRSDGSAWRIEADGRQPADGEEFRTGRYWGTAPVYRKRVDISAGPNAGTANTAHGISSLAAVLKVEGMIDDGAGVNYPLPSPAASAASIHVAVDGTNVVLDSSGNYSAWSGFVLLEYTKS